jgi:hypothetical protein
MKQKGLYLGSMTLGAVIFALAVSTSRDERRGHPLPSAPASPGSRAGRWLRYALGLFLMAQGVVGLIRSRSLAEPARRSDTPQREEGE